MTSRVSPARASSSGSHGKTGSLKGWHHYVGSSKSARRIANRATRRKLRAELRESL